MINKEHITNITDKLLKNTPIALISAEDGKIALPIIGAYGFSGDSLNAMWEHVGAGANLPVNSPVVAF